MKKILPLIVVCMVIVMGSLMKKPAVIDMSLLFEGYPCQDNCTNFKSGFEFARDQQFTKVEQCTAVTKDKRLGCQSYLHEYTVEHIPQEFL